MTKHEILLQKFTMIDFILVLISIWTEVFHIDTRVSQYSS
jgi:hypothetical protein